jgi:hypothetical protein
MSQDSKVDLPSIGSNAARWIPLAVVAAFYLFLAYIRFQLLELPLGRNEGTYGYMGQQVLLGAVPFTDFYEMKPTGLYFSYALLIAIFGSTTSGMHLGLLFINLATGLCLYAVAGRLWKQWAAGFVAITFGWLTLNPDAMGLALDVEHMIVLQTCLAGWFILRGHGRSTTPSLVAAGLLGGLSIATKQTSVFFVLALMLWIFCNQDLSKRRSSSIARALLAYAAGVGGIIALVLVYHLAAGNLEKFWYWTFTFPANFYGVKVSLAQGLSLFKIYLLEIVKPYIWIYLFGLVGVVLAMFRSPRYRTQGLMILALLGASVLAILPGFRFYGHYALFLTPGVALLVGLGIHLVKSRYSGRRHFGAAALLLYLAVAVTGIAFSKWNYLRPDLDAISKRIYGGNPFVELDRIADELRRRGDLKDDVVVFGSEPQLYLTLGVRAPQHQLFPAYLAKLHPRKNEMLRNYKASVESTKPKFAVMVRHPFSWGLGPKDDPEIYLWAKRFLATQYRPILRAKLNFPNPTTWVHAEQIQQGEEHKQHAVTLYEIINRD